MIIDLFLWALLIVFSPVILLCGIATLIIALLFVTFILFGFAMLLFSLIKGVLGLFGLRKKNTTIKTEEP